jgi:O-antigen ligase
MKLLEVAVGLAALVGLGAWFRRLILTDRSLVLAVFLLSLYIAETVLYESLDVPFGLFHLHAGSFQIRTLDVLLIVALIARLSVPRGRVRLDSTTYVWLLFAAWMTFEALLGIHAGNSRSFALDEFKALLYLSTAYIVGGARLDRKRDLRVLTRFTNACAVLVAVLLVCTLGHFQIELHVPGLEGAVFGPIGSVSSSLFPAIGLVALAIFLCSRPLRNDQFVSAVVLLTSAFASGQRASLLAIVTSLVVLVVLPMVAFRHLGVTTGQFFLGLFVLGFVAGIAWLGLVVASGKVIVPFDKEIALVFSGQEKALSAQDRVNQLVVAKSLIREHPVIGWGLGKTFVYYEAGFRDFETTNITHNILADLLLRTGIVGLVLFLTAFFLSFNDAVKTWRFRRLETGEAAIALATAAILAGWFAHGMVESLIDHVRLTPMAFIFVGLARGAMCRARMREGVSAEPGFSLVGHGFSPSRDPQFGVGQGASGIS